ncbi:MAG: hypothetical protein K2N99_00055, partial [Malacoplasma sp.]|nr:hypothetical protein [Malacoplasma sp.]
AITDNKERTILLDTQNDSITTTTSGSKIEQIGDVINMESDTLNITADSLVKIKTDTMEVEANSIKETATDVEYEFDNFTQTTDVGEWDVDDEKHVGSSFGVEYDTVFLDASAVASSGTVYLPQFTVGSVSNINILPQPTNGDTSTPGAMMLKTDPAGVPLVKFPQLIACLTQIAAAADAFPSGAGAGASAVAAFASLGMTQKIMAS